MKESGILFGRNATEYIDWKTVSEIKKLKEDIDSKYDEMTKKIDEMAKKNDEMANKLEELGKKFDNFEKTIVSLLQKKNKRQQKQ